MYKFKLYYKITTLSVAVMLLSFLGSCDKPDSAHCRVVGEIENVSDSIFYAVYESNNVLKVDTLTIDEKGKFEFQAPVDTMTLVSFFFKNGKTPTIVVDKTWKVEVKGDINTPDLIMAKGGYVNDDFTAFKKENLNLLKSRSDLINKLHDVSVTDSIDNNPKLVELNNINFELMNIVSQYVKDNPTKASSVLLINNYLKDETAIKRLSEAMSEIKGLALDFPLYPYLKAYNDKINISAIDAKAPSFYGENQNDKRVNLATYKSKYLLMIFLSTDCKICNDLQPSLIATYKNLKKDKSIDFEFASIVKDVEEKPLVKNKNIKWDILPEQGGWSAKTFELYNIKNVPYAILISPQGIILDRNVSLLHLEDKIKSYKK